MKYSTSGLVVDPGLKVNNLRTALSSCAIEKPACHLTGANRGQNFSSLCRQIDKLTKELEDIEMEVSDAISFIFICACVLQVTVSMGHSKSSRGSIPDIRQVVDHEQERALLYKLNFENVFFYLN